MKLHLILLFWCALHVVTCTQDQAMLTETLPAAVTWDNPSAGSYFNLKQVRRLVRTVVKEQGQPHSTPSLNTATEFLILVTMDGLRWQEVFNGADSILLFDPRFNPKSETMANQFWAPTELERRKRLMPFFWNTLARQGQILGNRRYGNFVSVANTHWFSYPGYNEMLTGRPDDWRIFTNFKWRNPNRNLLEMLHQQPEFHGKVQAFATWDAFPYIFNEKRAGFPVYGGIENQPKEQVSFQIDDPELKADARTWQNAFEHLQQDQPRLVFIGFNATDAHAHAGRYDLYLEAAHQVDQWLSELWSFIQQHPIYRDRTTLMISTDHGRGQGSFWQHHHAAIAGSDAIWLAVAGPDTPSAGEGIEPIQIWQKQIASTCARFLNAPFLPGHRVAEPIDGVFCQQKHVEAISGKKK